MAAISPVAGLLSSISTIAGVLGTAFTVLTGPIGLVVAAIAAVIAIGVSLYKNWDTIKEKAGELWSNITSTFESIKSSVSDKINAAKDSVYNAIQRIKSFFNFSWSLPRLALPHFSITGKFSLNPPSIPTIGVEWYAKAMGGGMILDSPTIFGMQGNRLLAGGEAGPEVVVGASSLYDMIQKATGNKTVNAPITLNVTVNGDVRNPDRFTQKLASNLVNLMNRESEVFK